MLLKQRSFVVFLLIAMLVLSFASMASAKQVIRLAHVIAPSFNSGLHTAAVVFAEYVDRFGEDIEVSIYPSGQLGNERDLYEAMRMGGSADASISGTAILTNYSSKLGVLDLPFLWADFDHVHRVMDGEVGAELAEEMEQFGFKILAWMDNWGYRNLVTKRPINSYDDLRGLRIRTIETPIYVKAMEIMGVNPTPMAYGEIYTAMQTGIIDGLEHDPSVILADNFYEVADHITLTKHLFGVLAFVISMDTWDSLSDYNKTIVQNAANIARDYQRSLAPIIEARALNQLIEYGMTTTEIDTTPFVEGALEFQNQHAKNANALHILEKIREEVQN